MASNGYLDNDGGLVTAGPYRWVRHPIYSSILLFMWTGTLSHLSVATVAGTALLSLGVPARIFAEERLVVIKYPEYRSYASRTKRIIPFIM